MSASVPEDPPFLFMRHGQTDYNLRLVRCGGDIDIPLTVEGEDQARRAAGGLRDLDIDIIIASPLIRTRQTAGIVREYLGGHVPLAFHPGLIERRLGAWNGLPIASTQADLAAGATPPGGEAERDFRVRVAGALTDILAAGHRMPLLVASKGIGRVIDLALGAGSRPPADNAAVLRFRAPPGRLDGFLRDTLRLRPDG